MEDVRYGLDRALLAGRADLRGIHGGRLAVRHYGFWSLNACRIVYVVDDRGAHPRFGFAYGTLTEHGESGRRTLHGGDAAGRPNGLVRDLRLLAAQRIGAPGISVDQNAPQKRFARDSKEAMRRAVSAA